MDLSAQASLLRVLQEKEIMRIGDSKPTPVDVRVILLPMSHLNKWLHQEIPREDLYYRLNAIPTAIPPPGSGQRISRGYAATFYENSTRAMEDQ